MIRKLLALVALVALVGCSHTYHPGKAPEVSLIYVGAFERSYSVDLIHDQPDTTVHLFSAGRDGKHYANYNEWTTFFLNSFKKDLKKRGVKVTSGSPNKMKIRVSDFSYRHRFFKVRVYMTLTLSDPDGSWSKEIRATAASAASTGRAYGGIIHNTILGILNDREVMERMRI